MDFIRVIVIDDSALIIKELTDILKSDQRIQVIATAGNGQDAIHKIKKYHPDVITLDNQIPMMDGETVLENIMREHPLPVVIISENTKDSITRTVTTISHEAVDFITKPSEYNSLHRMKDEVIKKVIAASQAKITNANVIKPVNNQIAETIVAIGTSTGGPRALQQVLGQLPNELPVPILIVQHIPDGFTKSLADRLNRLVPFTVKEASDKEVIQNGTVYIAPANFHLKVVNRWNELVIDLSQEVALRGHRPSVDVLFHSVAHIKKRNKIAVVLTGMGRDGAEGIRKLKKFDPNSVVIAESQETAVIYGMPKAAVSTNFVDYEVPLFQVGRIITNTINKVGGNEHGNSGLSGCIH